MNRYWPVFPEEGPIYHPAVEAVPIVYPEGFMIGILSDRISGLFACAHRLSREDVKFLRDDLTSWLEQEITE